MAGRFGRKLMLVLIGFALFVLWTRFSDGDDATEQVLSIPSVVFEGGGGTLDVRFTTNQPAEFRFAFDKWNESTEDFRSVGGAESFDPGSYSRSIDVSPETYIYLELGVPGATPGAELSWTIGIDGRQVIQESDQLTDPLPSGYAFFLQAEADAIDEMRQWR